MPSLAAILGFDALCQQAQGFCRTQYARTLLAQAAFSSNFDEVRLALTQTEEMRQICAAEDAFPNAAFVDALHLTAKMRIAGGYITEAEMLTLLQMLDTGRLLTRFFALSEARYPHLAALAAQAQDLPQISKRIEELIDPSGAMKDTASPALLALRQSARNTERQIARQIQKTLAFAQANGYCPDNAQPSIRSGRAVIPINAPSKHKINGIVLDESGSGKTAFIEPIEAVHLNNRLVELTCAERREAVRILQEFADFARPCIPQMEQAARFAGFIDFVRSKALTALQMNARLPLLAAAPLIDWRNARHPLLEGILAKEGKTIVPLNLRLTDSGRILLISGPNAGGKSAALKTAGLVQYMMQCGFLPPVDEGSRAGVFERIFIDIGDQQSLENELSTYSSHLANMKFFLQNAAPRTLVLIDELGSGTEPHFGGAIAQAVLQELAASRTFGVITTHYANLKHYAARTEGIQNGAMLFDEQRFAPLFILKTDTAGSSFALEIAQKIGLPASVISAAKLLMGAELTDIDQTLRSIALTQRHLEDERRRITEQSRRLQELTAQRRAAIDALQTERKQILRQARERAAALIVQANRQIENTICGIRETQADRARTKDLRSRLREFAQTLQPNKDHPPAQNSLPAFEIGSAVKRRGGGVSYSGQASDFYPNIDVRGLRSAEALPKIEAWIDRALMSSFGTLRILHGTGSGALKEHIRQYLRTLSCVQKFYDESVECGGAGITIVEVG